MKLMQFIERLYTIVFCHFLSNFYKAIISNNLFSIKTFALKGECINNMNVEVYV